MGVWRKLEMKKESYRKYGNGRFFVATPLALTIET
jgi:hypothetical protein